MSKSINKACSFQFSKFCTFFISKACVLAISLGILQVYLFCSHVQVTAADALESAKELIHTHGLLVGPSSGAALCAAKALASLPENHGKTIITLLPDTGCRYLSQG